MNPNYSEKNKTLSGGLVRTPLQSKFNICNNNNNESNIKQTPDLKNKSMIIKTNENAPQNALSKLNINKEILINSEELEEEDLGKREIGYNIEKECEDSERLHTNKIKIIISVDDLKRVKEDVDENQENLELNQDIEQNDQIFTYINSIDIKNMKKINSWVNEGIAFAEFPNI
jgi:hypothetical protein